MACDGVARTIPAATFAVLTAPGGSGAERIHATHPLVRAIVERVRADSSPTLHNLVLEYTGSRHRITSVEPLLGRRGFWFVYRLSLEALESQDQLIHVVLAAPADAAGELRVLPQDVARHFTGITAGPAELSDPRFDAAVRTLAERERDRILDECVAEVRETNENCLDAELDKLDRYTEESLLESQDRLHRMREQWQDAKRRRDRAAGDERRQLREEILRLERAYASALRSMTEINTERLDDKSRRREELEAQLPVRSSHALIAIARWELR